MTLIGVQLWTVRDQLNNVGPLFERLAAAGVQAVEPFGLGNTDTETAVRIARAREIRAAADAAGLRILSAHTRLPAERTSEFVDEMHELGVTYAISSAPEHTAGFDRELLLSAERIRQYGETITALAEAVESDGLQIGYHNHYWEWNVLEGGALAYDVLWENLGPKVITELDVLWATFAGQDAVEIASRLSERIRLLHMGDALPITNTDHQLPAGAGEAPLIPALEAAGPVDAVFIEATTPPPGSTQLDLIRESATWLTTAIAEHAR